MQGTIHRLIRGKGFGFIQTEASQYFFHHSEVRGIEFRQLTTGDVVEFQPVEEEPGKNPRAVEVSVVVKAPSPPPRAPSGGPEGGQGGHGGQTGQRFARSGPRAVGNGQRQPRRRTEGDAFGSGLGSEGPAPDEGAFDGLSDDAFADGSEDDREFSEELPHTSTHEASVDSFQPARGASRPAPRGRGRTDGFRGQGGPRGRGGRGDGQQGRRPRGGRSRGQEGPRRPKATGMPGARGEGIVRSINVERGFGFIETATGDLFFHKSGVKDGFEALDIGSRVAFVFGEGDRGAKAEDVSVV